MSFPCVACGGQCCGPVPVSKTRLSKIVRLIARMPVAERQRLAAQRREMVDCGFYDMERHRCAVYAARPEVCQVYGLTRDLQCPHSPALVTEISPAGAMIRLRRDSATDMALVSHQWTWEVAA